MIKLSQQAIVDLFIDKLQQLGCKRTVRTVNRQDPTEVVVVEGKIGMKYGLLSEPCEEPPDPQIVKVKVVDTSYGIEINFCVVLDDEKTSLGLSRTAWSSAYLDGDKWHRVTSEQFFHDLQRLMTEAVSAEEVEDILLDTYSESLADYE